MDKFRRKVVQIKSAVVDVKNRREASVYDEKRTLKMPPFPAYDLTKAISNVFADVQSETLKEQNIYNSSFDSSVLVDHTVDEETEELEAGAHNYVESFKGSISFYPIFDFPENKLEFPPAEHELTAAEINLYKAVSAELEFASDNMVQLGYTIAVLNKIKTAVASIGQKRVKDAMTLLGVAKKDSPNNRSLAYIGSQIAYFRAQNGSSESLPEARADAKRACLYSEDCDPSQLLHYRYVYALHESNFDAKKSLELMREFYLLNPESLTGGGGLGTHEGIHLKTWMILAGFDPELLTSFEIDSLLTIITTAPSGVNFYLNVMRPLVLKRLNNASDVAIQKLLKVEEMLATSYDYYKDIVATIEQNYDKKGELTPKSENMWTIEKRYTSLLLKAAPTPKFDEIYLYTSLDAKRHSSEAYPNRAMAAMGLNNVNYWQVWSLAITAAEGKGSSRTLPVKHIAAHAEIYKNCDQLLVELEAAEKEIIPDAKWEIIEKYMPDYEYEIFPHVAAGPDAFKVPTNPYYLNFYRQWVTERPRDAKPSVILKEYAEQGNFIDAEEIMAAFEGVIRVMSDEVHGLKARAKVALKECLKDTKSGKADKAKDMLREGHFNDFWWLYVIVLPLAGLAFYVVSGSSGSGMGIMTLLIIIVFAAGLGYAMYSMSQIEDVDEDDDEEEALLSGNEEASPEKDE